MKLSEMSVVMLRKKATKEGVAWIEKTSQEQLVKKIREARAAREAEAAEPPKFSAAQERRKERKAGAPKNNPEVQPGASPTTWPEDWPKHMRAAYYQRIVGGAMPKNAKSAWATLQQTIEIKAQKAEPVKAKSRFCCFGLDYNSESKACTTVCEDMPLCAHICATRPQLKDHVAKIEQAAQELAASQTKKRGRPTKSVTVESLPEPDIIPAAASTPAYRWVVDINDFDAEEGDPITFAVCTWMAGGKKGVPIRFNRARLISKLVIEGVMPDNAEAVADEMIENFVQEEYIKQDDVAVGKKRKAG